MAQAVGSDWKRFTYLMKRLFVMRMILNVGLTAWVVNLFLMGWGHGFMGEYLTVGTGVGLLGLWATSVMIFIIQWDKAER